ncbi:putative RNA recognition motif domain, nucleotide-binding alpha-beta plait domain superfamily [Helianthus anomalus]
MVRSRPQPPVAQVDLHELRQRKTEELNRLRNNTGRGNEEWHQVWSKRSIREERRFQNKEDLLRKQTPFFLTNLPEQCTTERLWEAFAHLDNFRDAFVPYKKDGRGNGFGFVRFSDARNLEEHMGKLRDVRIDGAVIGVSVAKFRRDGIKVELQNLAEKRSVFSRLGP